MRRRVAWRWVHPDGSRLVWYSGGGAALCRGPSGPLVPLDGIATPAEAEAWATERGFGRRKRDCAAIGLDNTGVVIVPSKREQKQQQSQGSRRKIPARPLARGEWDGVVAAGPNGREFVRKREERMAEYARRAEAASATKRDVPLFDQV